MTVRELKKTSAERFTIVFDDDSELHSTLKVVTDEYIFSGKDLSDEEYIHLCEESKYSLCESHALKLLSYQPLSKKMLIDKLIKKGEEDYNAERAAQWLEEMGMINDENYSEMVVRHYSAKGYGTKRIQNELYRHGIPRELWDDALKGMPSQDDKIDSFVRARLTDPSDRKQVKKVSDALLRRGFSWSEIKSALERFRDSYENEDNYGQ